MTDEDYKKLKLLCWGIILSIACVIIGVLVWVFV